MSDWDESNASLVTGVFDWIKESGVFLKLFLVLDEKDSVKVMKKLKDYLKGVDIDIELQ